MTIHRMRRRDFIRFCTQTAGTLSIGKVASALDSNRNDPDVTLGTPWYRRTFRWGQVFVTESVPADYDIKQWRRYWNRVGAQGLIISAGGSVAFYPSKIPLHRQVESLNGRDLYGELAEWARQDGQVVLARVDSYKAREEVFRAYPDWFAKKQSGEPYREGESYLPCTNGPYYDEYMPAVLQEIIERTHPDGIAEAGFTRLTRDSICYCENCAKKFREKTGLELPQKDWNSLAYRQWMQWNYARRVELWEFNNRITRAAGGPRCVWVAMLYHNDVVMQARRFWDLREICRRTELMLWDYISRADDDSGFQSRGGVGKLVHQLAGWDKVFAANSTPDQMIELSELTVERSLPAGSLQSDYATLDFDTFRRAFPAIPNTYGSAKPEPEARLWDMDGLAGGVQPWYDLTPSEDRRAYLLPKRVFHWHKQHECYLTHRQPVAVVGIVWSQRNLDYYGRDEAAERVQIAYQGFVQALIRARIPYLPVHASDIEAQSADLTVLILPNVGALSNAECSAIRQFAQRGGAVIATGATSLYDEWGDAREDFGLADLFGAHGPSSSCGRKSLGWSSSYLRMWPRGAGTNLPGEGVSPKRHPVLSGFDDTDIMAFGGSELERLKIDGGMIVPLTAHSSDGSDDGKLPGPEAGTAALVLNASGNRRVAYLPADIDRLYALNGFPDHGDLLANLVRWAGKHHFGFELLGPGLFDCHVYRQPGRLIVHLVNLSDQRGWRRPLDGFIPIGPLTVKLDLPSDVRGRYAECLVSGADPSIAVKQGRTTVVLESVLDHEVLVVS